MSKKEYTPVKSVKSNRPEIKVACILNKGSYECFKYECTLCPLSFPKWRKQMDSLQPHFLIVESTWSGMDGSWKNQIVGDTPTVIMKLFKYCKERNIITIFWNTLDISHYKDFLRISREFDFIFASNQILIDQYKQDMGHDRVYSLSFAAQPMLHNPIHASYRKKERKIAYLNNGDQSLKPIDIHAPKILKNNIHDGYLELSKKFKKYKVILCPENIRQSYEIMASNTCRWWGNQKPILDRLLTDPLYAERVAFLGLREVFSKHLYQHRLDKILMHIGLEYHVRPLDGVSVITCTNKPNYLQNVLDNFVKQAWSLKELIIVLNSDIMDLDFWREKAKLYPNISIFQLPEKVSLGRCLNFAIERAMHPYVAKFDDDDYYAPNYLLDLMHAFQYSRADIVGKRAIFAYIEGKRALVERHIQYEHEYVNWIGGARWVAKRKVFKKVSFADLNIGEDVRFFKECTLKGIKIYSADRYNFVYMRRKNHLDHTWQISDEQFLKSCRIIAYTDDYKSFVTL